MSGKHTPGPWEVGSHFVGPLHVMTTKDRHIVAQVGNPTHAHTFTQVEANAHLIAAAPEMLEVLHGVRAFCPVHVQEDIDALIAKAEGR